MDVKYVILLNCGTGEIIKIRLSREERKRAAKYEDFEMFLYTIEKKYSFRVSECSWMATNELCERIYMNEED